MRSAGIFCALLLLSACGGDEANNAVPSESNQRISAARVQSVAPAAVPGERKSYEFSWNGTSLFGKSRVANLSDLASPPPEIRLVDITLSFDSAGPAGQLYRLYQAAFGRKPDVSGLGFWKDKLDTGSMTLSEIASAFLESPESRTLYGFPLTNEKFIEGLYRNVLSRAPDTSGRLFWLNALQGGTSRTSILLSFAESPENKQLTASALVAGIAYAEPAVAYQPVAEAIGPTDAPVGANVIVDGSKSSDANDDSLRYNWTLAVRPAGSAAILLSKDSAKPHLTLDAPGRYEITLSTDDGKLQSFSSARIVIQAHNIVSDTGSYRCEGLTDTVARDLYAHGYTFLDRNNDGTPCNAADAAVEAIPPAAIADTGLYKCSAISHTLALQLYRQGHTYLDRDNDGKPCESTDITVETYVPPVVSPPSSGQCWVNGYYRKNGTYVHGYWRRC